MFDSGCVLDWHLLSAGDDVFAILKCLFQGFLLPLLLATLVFPVTGILFRGHFVNWFGECFDNFLGGTALELCALQKPIISALSPHFAFST